METFKYVSAVPPGSLGAMATDTPPQPQPQPCEHLCQQSRRTPLLTSISGVHKGCVLGFRQEKLALDIKGDLVVVVVVYGGD